MELVVFHIQSDLSRLPLDTNELGNVAMVQSGYRIILTLGSPEGITSTVTDHFAGKDLIKNFDYLQKQKYQSQVYDPPYDPIFDALFPLFQMRLLQQVDSMSHNHPWYRELKKSPG